MIRTNIVVDEALIEVARRRYGLRTMRDVVDLALRRLVEEPMSREEALGMQGMGWNGDLETLRQSRVVPSI